MIYRKVFLKRSRYGKRQLTMATQLRLQRHQLADLQLIRDIPPPSLGKVLEQLNKLGSTPVRPTKLRAALCLALPEQERVVDAMLRQVLSLSGLMRQAGLDSHELFDALREALEPHKSEWSNDEVTRWSEIEAPFRSVLETEAVALSTKALDLSYAHAHLFQRARILTEIRPIFDESATSIKGSVVGHTLLINFDDCEGEHLLHLAVDENDIRLITEECDRALRKSGTARTHFEQVSPVLNPTDSDNE